MFVLFVFSLPAMAAVALVLWAAGPKGLQFGSYEPFSWASLNDGVTLMWKFAFGGLFLWLAGLFLVLVWPRERARGGKVDHEEHEKKHRAKGGRVRGEGVGADRMPLSSAAKIKEVTPGEQAEGANED